MLLFFLFVQVAMATEEVGSGRECLSERFNISITRSDIATLTHLNWLNDEVQHFVWVITFRATPHWKVL